MRMKISYFSALLCLCLCSSILAKQVKQSVNLVIYESENREGASVEYRDNAPSFYDTTQAIADAGIANLALICAVSGVFIFYAHLEYIADNPQDVRIFSGPGKCINPSYVELGSLRHSATRFVDPETTPHLTVFTEANYGGFMYSVTEKSERGLARMMPVQSIMAIGPANWTITTTSGTKICLNTVLESPEEVNICLIPSAEEFFKTGADGPLLQWSKVTVGCDGGEEWLVNTCFDYFSGEVQQPAIGPKLPKEVTTTPSGSGEKMTTVDPGTGTGVTTITGTGSQEVSENGTTSRPGTPGPAVISPVMPAMPSPFEGECGDFEDLAFLLRMRVTNDFVSAYQLLLPIDKTHSWRTELLDVTFEVAAKFFETAVDSFPPHLIPQVRESLIYLIEKQVWSQGKGFPEKKPTHELNVAVHQTQQCLANLDGSSVMRNLRDNLRGDLSATDQVPAALIATQFQVRWNQDLVMEFAYMIFNLVSVTCHQVNGFDSNYWLDYITLADDMYLTPMVPHWTKPGLVGRSYSILFAGYDVSLQFHRVAAVTTVMFGLMKYMEVYPRPDQVA